MTKSVAIVGAGIVGATAAYQLSKKGIAVTVFDAGVGQATKAATPQSRLVPTRVAWGCVLSHFNGTVTCGWSCGLAV